MSEWKEVTIGNVCSVKRGASPRPIQNYMCKNGMPWVKIADATRSNSRYINTTEEFIIEEGVSKSRLVTPGTLIVSNSATPGLPKIMGITGCVHDGWLIIDDFNGVLKEYMYYKFIDIRRVLSNQANGSVFMNLKTDIVKSFPISVPTIEEQTKIVSLLENLDSKIECNQNICRNLEAQAQALFKHWFVDFAPFKDGRFVESELGMIPEGWRVGTLGEICTTNKRTYNGQFCNKIKYLDTGSITENVISEIQELDPNVDKIPSRARRSITECDIVFSTVRPNQKHYGFLMNPPSDLIASTGFCVITACWTGYSFFIYEFIKQKRIIQKLQAIAEQSVSTYPSIKATDIEKLQLVIPPINTCIEPIEALCSMYQKMDLLSKESSRLSSLRDTLLPKLMSGEIKL